MSKSQQPEFEFLTLIDKNDLKSFKEVFASLKNTVASRDNVVNGLRSAANYINLAYGPSIDCTGSVLSYACKLGRTDFVKYLLEEESVSYTLAQNEELDDGMSPLLIAVNYGKVDVVKYLISRDLAKSLQKKKLDSVISSNGSQKYSPLELAVITNNYDIVEALIRYNSNLMASNYYSPLDYACMNGNKKITLLLLTKVGATINFKSEESTKQHPYLANIVKAVDVAVKYIDSKELQPDILKDMPKINPEDIEAVIDVISKQKKSSENLTDRLLKIRDALENQLKEPALTHQNSFTSPEISNNSPSATNSTIKKPAISHAAQTITNTCAEAKISK